MTKEEFLSGKYSRAAEKFLSMAAIEEKRLLLIAILRLVVFILIVSLLLAGTIGGLNKLLYFIPVALTAFLWLLKRYSIHSENKRFLTKLSVINSNEAAAIMGDLTAFDGGRIYLDASHDFTFDADIFGDSSLFQFLNRTITGIGRDKLAGWLSDPFIIAEDFEGRQEVVRELAAKEEWRHRFMGYASGDPLERRKIEILSGWLQEPDSLRWLAVRKAALVILPSFAFVSLGLLIEGAAHYSLFIGSFLLNLTIVAAGAGKTNRIHSVLSRRHDDLELIEKLVRLISEENFDSTIMKSFREELIVGGNSAAAAFKGLARLVKAFDSRLNMIAAFFLNGFLLWDYQCIFRLGRWRREYRGEFKSWIEAIASVDAYISLGNYAFNHPDFCYPSTDRQGNLISARQLGHPLIAGDKRICNDFTLSRDISVCFISGANMAGKSTFLRTVVVNLVLAMTGAPVCAEEMLYLPVRLFTSMRTTDSLPGNESYFYAELKRLKALKTRVETGEEILFILDEILKGTNSEDKSLGSKLFLKKMMEAGGTGLVATHDLSICRMESAFPGKIINKCFEITIDGEQIGFDYILRGGITKNMNAALLMKQMGIID